jgi:hypothetical protein
VPCDQLPIGDRSFGSNHPQLAKMRVTVAAMRAGLAVGTINELRRAPTGRAGVNSVHMHFREIEETPMSLHFPIPRPAAILLVMACAALSACNGSNDPITGRVSVDMGSHEVVVTNCHVQKVPDVKSSDDGNSRQFSVCNQSIVFQGTMLFVNGDSYGQIAEGDRVLVEDGKVSIHPR